MGRTVRIWMIGLAAVLVLGLAVWQVWSAVRTKLPAGAPQQAQAAKDPWYPIQEDQGGYAVEMPYKAIDITTDLGNGVRSHGWSGGKDNDEVGVWYWDLPANTDPQKYLAALAEGLKHLPNMEQERVVDQRPITLDGHPGLELQFPYTETRTAMVRLYVKNHRLYFLQFITNRWDETASMRERFVNSFRFLPPEVKKY